MQSRLIAGYFFRMFELAMPKYALNTAHEIATRQEVSRDTLLSRLGLFSVSNWSGMVAMVTFQARVLAY